MKSTWLPTRLRVPPRHAIDRIGNHATYHNGWWKKNWLTRIVFCWWCPWGPYKYSNRITKASPRVPLVKGERNLRFELTSTCDVDGFVNRISTLSTWTILLWVVQGGQKWRQQPNKSKRKIKYFFFVNGHQRCCCNKLCRLPPTKWAQSTFTPPRVQWACSGKANVPWWSEDWPGQVSASQREPIM